MHHVKRVGQNENYTVISAEKRCLKKFSTFRYKTTQKLAVGGNLVNMIHGLYGKLTGNMKLSIEGKNLQPLALKSRQRCSLSPLPLNNILEVPARVIKKK